MSCGVPWGLVEGLEDLPLRPVPGRSRHVSRGLCEIFVQSFSQVFLSFRTVFEVFARKKVFLNSFAKFFEVFAEKAEAARRKKMRERTAAAAAKAILKRNVFGFFQEHISHYKGHIGH